MPKAVIDNAPRRDLLKAGAAFLLAGTLPDAAPIAACADAPLLDRCSELHELFQLNERDNLAGVIGRTDAELDARGVRFAELVQAITDLPARTPEGLRAKALALECVLTQYVAIGIGETLPEAEDAEGHELLAWSLARDVQARA